MRNANEVRYAPLMEIEFVRLTDSKFKEYPEPHPAHVQVAHLVLVEFLVGASEYTTSYNGNRNRQCDQTESARQDYLLPKADPHVP